MPDVKKTDLAALHQMIDAMAEAIAPVTASYAEAERAHAEKLNTQIVLVEGLLALAADIVRAIGTRPKISEELTSDSSQLASWRGLVLTCRPREALSHNGLEPESHETGGLRKGTYGGSHVFLRDDGRLVALFYVGGWDVDETCRGPNEWRATEREISVETFCRDWAAAAEPKKLATQMLKFIEKAGDRSKAIAKARELTDKYRAIAALL
jgi:hypothetical protein